MHCPVHEDRKRSAQINFDKGLWNCHAGCRGGTIDSLFKMRDRWVPAPNGSGNGNGHANGYKSKAKEEPQEIVSEARIRAWHQDLMENEPILDDLMTMRGLFSGTIARFEIGWDKAKKAYTLPVRGVGGEIFNIRRYQLRPPSGRRKIWGITGMNEPRLFPASVLVENPDEIIICEGEMDALLTNQYGFPAITRTGAAKVWRQEWNEAFEGKIVYLCHDMDEAGQDGNRRVGRALRRIAREVRVVRLPYPITEKHGKDLTDYWLERDGDAEEFRRLLEEAEPFDPRSDEEPELVDDASVLDALDSRRVGRPLRLTVTIKGKRDPGYSVPRKARYRCTRDAGAKCNVCPMQAKGEDERIIAGSDPVVLELMDSTKLQVGDILRRSYGIPKCAKLTVDTLEHQSVEVLFARPSVDHSGGEAGAYKNLKITSVGRHDTLPNNTVRVVGALHPDPRKQLNEFLAWDISQVETSLDRFEMDRDNLKKLKRFQPKANQRPLKKLGDIARELSSHVTQIYGRPEMHAAMDLTFHSASAFYFNGKLINRGWLDLLIVGDTRTGKSEAATRLSQHYRAGEIISCESATFAGIVGGLQQYGASKEWAITWGAIPLNDKRLVVLDEVSGLQPEEIAEMSSVRSSGIAQLTKIQQEQTFARTRLIWLGNPRNGKMSDYTYGVQAIQPLIGNPEDIARFDIAMSVRAGEVSADEINRRHETGKAMYTSEACSALIRWIWSRNPDQIVWAKGAEDAVFRAANALGKRYIEDPPLVQAANVREKIARLAVALAGRLFSTDETGERIIVRREHVRDAVAFLDRVYNMIGFGYAERSRQLIANRKEAESRTKDIKEYMYRKPQLAQFLRGTGKFRRQDLEEILNIDREQANAIISKLWDTRMVRKLKGDIWVEPTLHEILREVNV